MSETETETESVRQACLRMVMRPFARYCIRHAHSFQEFIKVAKLTFIEVAAEEIRKTTEKVNPSRLSVMTGIYRREVTKIYKDKEEPSERQAGILGRVLLQWEQDPEFQDKNGTPKILRFKGEKSEFSALVEKVSKHVPSGSVLFEMTRIGIAKKTKQGLELVRRLPGHRQDPRKGFELLSREVDTVVRTAEENISGERGYDNLHIRTEFDNLVLEELPNIRSWLIEEGKQFHVKVRAYLSQFDKDIQSTAAISDDKTGGGKVVVSLFGRACEKD
ncbi:MAG: hypothetical protein KDD64_17415 [Bdellovibrionales bacterium]|nr:hypothetical protein [Bdellovibrionales bacterium]